LIRANFSSKPIVFFWSGHLNFDILHHINSWL
jgi:hypothetical protein